MELIIDEEKRKIYQQDNKFYTLLDMGNYVGSRTRSVFEEVPEYWVLMYYEDKDNNIKIESLVSEQGLYMRFLMDKNNVRRCIHLHDYSVYYDSVTTVNKNSDIFDLGKTYTALDKQYYDDDQNPLQEHLNHKPVFYSRHGEIFEKDFVTNDILIEFLLKNNELVSNLQNEKKGIKVKVNRKSSKVNR